VLPPPVPAGLPSHLLERRPDVIAAEHSFNAAFHLVQAAEAARLPTISLTGAGGYATNALLQDLRYLPWTWTLAGQLVTPIYTGGFLQAQVHIADQNQKAALALYGQTALQAFDDVEVALTNEHYLKDEEKDATGALNDTEDALLLAKIKYNVGQTDLSPVLDLEKAVTTTQMATAYVQQELIANRINLYLALGGSF
jgi:outer membrane protein, multidrug efflux system